MWSNLVRKIGRNVVETENTQGKINFFFHRKPLKKRKQKKATNKRLWRQKAYWKKVNSSKWLRGRCSKFSLFEERRQLNLTQSINYYFSGIEIWFIGFLHCNLASWKEHRSVIHGGAGVSSVRECQFEIVFFHFWFVHVFQQWQQFCGPHRRRTERKNRIK